MRNMYTLLVNLILASLLICSPGGDASFGGDSSGTIVRGGTFEGGIAVAGASVKMCPANYMPEPDRLMKVKADKSNNIFTAVTDEDGFYSFDSVPPGNYTIVAEKDSMLFVKIDSVIVDPAQGDTSVDPAILQPPASIEGTVPVNDGTSNLFVVAVGVDRFAKVDATGHFKLERLPAGKYELRLLDKTASGISTINTVVVTIDPHDSISVDIPEHGNARLGLKINETAPCTLSVERFGEKPDQGKQFIWYKDSEVYDTTESGILILDSVSKAEAGLYSCRIAGDTVDRFNFKVDITPKVTVRFLGNGFTGGSVSDSTELFAGMRLPLRGIGDNLVMPGYSLKAWNTKPDGSGKEYSLIDTLTVDTNDIPLYAIWEKNRYLVRFVDRGSVIDSQNVLFGDTVDDLTPAEQPGNQFIGWFSDSALTHEWKTGSDAVIGDLVLYAKWEAMQMLLTLQPGGSGQTAQPIPVQYGVPQAISADTMGHHKFSHWSVAGEGVTITDSLAKQTTVLLTDSNASVMAVFSPDTYQLVMEKSGLGTTAGSESIVYGEKDSIFAQPDSNSVFDRWEIVAGDAVLSDTASPRTTVELGSNATIRALFKRKTFKTNLVQNYYGVISTIESDSTELTVEYGVPFGIVAQPDVVNGYHFSGWEGKPAANVRFENATVCTTNVTITGPNTEIAARFAINKYGLTVVSSGNGTVIGTDSVDHGANVTITANPDSGYHFVGWRLVSGDAVINDTAKSTTTVRFENGDAILRAVFEEDLHTIRYVADDATSGSAPVGAPHARGDTVIVDGRGSMERVGYSFAGWNTRPDGSGTSYDSGDKIVITAGDAALYAQWKIESFTVSYSAGMAGSSGSVPRDSEYSYGSTVILDGDAVSLSKTGYTFIGWWDEVNHVSYPADTVFTMGAGTMVLYARWRVNYYRVFFDKNDSEATGEMAPIELAYGDTVKLSSGGFRKPRWFLGYWTDANGVRYNIGDNYTMRTERDDTLYARWYPIPYPVVFNGNGSDVTGTMNLQRIDFGTTEALSNNGFSRLGYDFAGWASDTGGPVSYANQANYAMITEGDTLYAKWIPNTYNVVFDGNGTGVTGTMASQSFVYGTTANLTANGFSWLRHSFAGWATSVAGTVVYVNESSYTMTTEGETLYAQWNLDTAGMVRINATGKSFQMGEEGEYVTLAHTVNFTADFWLDTTEVTQGQYRTLMPIYYSGYTSPPWSALYGAGDNYPVYYISWFDAVLYCNARTKAAGSNDTVYRYTAIVGIPGNRCSDLTGLVIDLNKRGFRLPTEAQWEYACRGGTTTSFYWGKNYNPYPVTVSDSNEIDNYAIWDRNSDSKGSGSPEFGIHPVATRIKNQYGLYDMSGNVWEWCNDWYGNYSVGSQYDPTGPVYGTSRVFRGGGWYYIAYFLRSASRGGSTPDNTENCVGFRVCLPAR